MPDEIAVTSPPLETPHDSADSYRQFFSDDGKLKGAPPAEAPVEDVVQSPPKEAPNVEATDEDGIPDQFLTDKKQEAPAVDEFAEMVKEAPKGQIAHERWRQLQTLSSQRVEAANKERDELRAQLEQLKSGQGVPEETKKELEALRKRADEAEAELERTAYERTPKFKERFVEPENRVREAVKGIGKEYNLEAADVEDLITVKGRRRDDMVEALEMTPAAKQRLITELSHLDRLSAERETELTRSRDQLRATYEEQERAAKANQERERAEEDRIFGERLEMAKSKLHGFMKIDGDEGWNKKVEGRIEYAKRFFNGQVKAEEMTDVILRGMNGEVQDKVIDRLKGQVKTLTEQLGKLTKAGPGGGQAPVGQGDNGKHDPGSTYESFMQAARSQQAGSFGG